MEDTENIVATAKFHKGALLGVTAVIRVPVMVEVDLYEDGTYLVRTKGDTYTLNTEDIEQTITREYEDDALAAAYASALEAMF